MKSDSGKSRDVFVQGTKPPVPQPAPEPRKAKIAKVKPRQRGGDIFGPKKDRQKSLKEQCSRDRKMEAVRQSADALYAVRAEMSNEIVAARAARNLSVSTFTMNRFIRSLDSQARREAGLPDRVHGKVSWYKSDGTPNR